MGYAIVITKQTRLVIDIFVDQLDIQHTKTVLQSVNQYNSIVSYIWLG